MGTEPLKVIDALTEDRDLVFRFFAVFSRFEYALKRSGFLKYQERAEADWDAYANGIRGNFSAIDHHLTAVAYAGEECRNADFIRTGRPHGRDTQLHGSWSCEPERDGRAFRNNLRSHGNSPVTYANNS